VSERRERATAPQDTDPVPDPGPAQPAGAAAAEGGRARPRRGGFLGALREGVIVVGTALVLSLLIKTFLAQAFYIPSESMQDTLVRNDRVLVSLLEPGPLDLERGDVGVFRDPGGWLDPSVVPPRSGLSEAAVEVLTFVGVLPQDAGEHLIKRVIGMPGDQVVCCDVGGRLTVNGEAIEETYLPEGTEPSTLTFDVIVPEDRIWVMGDNRGFSQDSRYHQDLEGGGTVSLDLVVGRAVLLFWPLDRFGTLSNHEDVFDDVPASP
jgi:signal peptidase I